MKQVGRHRRAPVRDAVFVTVASYPWYVSPRWCRLGLHFMGDSFQTLSYRCPCGYNDLPHWHVERRCLRSEM